MRIQFSKFKTGLFGDLWRFYSVVSKTIEGTENLIRKSCFAVLRENGGTIGKRKGVNPEFIGVFAFHSIIVVLVLSEENPLELNSPKLGSRVGVHAGALCAR